MCVGYNRVIPSIGPIYRALAQTLEVKCSSIRSNSSGEQANNWAMY